MPFTVLNSPKVCYFTSQEHFFTQKLLSNAAHPFNIHQFSPIEHAPGASHPFNFCPRNGLSLVLEPSLGQKSKKNEKPPNDNTTSAPSSEENSPSSPEKARETISPAKQTTTFTGKSQQNIFK